MASDSDRRRAQGEMTRAYVEQQRKQGVAVPDTRKAEQKAAEVARRHDRRESDRK